MTLSTNGIQEIWCQFHQRFKSSFYKHRSQKFKKTDSLTIFFAFLGSAGVIAPRKTLVKSTPGRDNAGAGGRGRDRLEEDKLHFPHYERPSTSLCRHPWWDVWN